MKISIKMLCNKRIYIARLCRMAALAAAFLLAASLSCRAAESNAPITILPITILIVGDSLSTAYGILPEQSWVNLLARDFEDAGRNINIANDSINGDTTASGVVRLPDALNRIRPHWVIIELGGNDGLRGVLPQVIEQNLREMVRITRNANAKPILFGMKLPPNYGAYADNFEKVYHRVAADTATPLLPFFIKGIEADRSMFLPDGIHPNAEAQEVILGNVKKFLVKLLDEIDN